MSDWEVPGEPTKAPRRVRRALVGSGRNGRPIAEIVARLEHRDPGLARDSGLSSAAMRAGDLVRSLRKAGGLSQSALARKIGASQARISEIEAGAGTQGPTWSVMERIFTACGARVIVEPGQPEQFVTIDSVVEWREPASNVAKSMAEDMSAASEGSEEIMAGTVEETFER